MLALKANRNAVSLSIWHNLDVQMADQTHGAPRRPQHDGPSRHGEVRTCDEVRPLAASIEGWSSDAQGCALFRAAAATTGKGAHRRNRIVERSIDGVAGRGCPPRRGSGLCGRSAYGVTRGSERRHARRVPCKPRERRPRQRVRDAVLTSAEAARVLDGPVELLFIDGDHSYEAVRLDAALWLPKLVEGGIVMFHDVGTAGYGGPRRLFRRSLCGSVEFEGIRRVGSMMVARRTRRRDVRSGAWELCAGLLLYLYDAQRVLRRAAHFANIRRRRESRVA